MGEDGIECGGLGSVIELQKNTKEGVWAWVAFAISIEFFLVLFVINCLFMIVIDGS